MPSLKDFTGLPDKLKLGVRWIIAALLVVIALQFATIAILLLKLP